MSTAGTHEDLTRKHEAKRGSDRAFGLVFAAFFTIIGCLPMWGGGSPRRWALYAALAMAIVALTIPRILTPFNWAWLLFGRVLGAITTPIVLGLMYVLVITPTALVMRIFGRDSLRRRFEPEAETYWIKRDPPGPKPGTMDVQF